MNLPTEHMLSHLNTFAAMRSLNIVLELPSDNIDNLHCTKTVAEPPLTALL